MTWTFTNNPSNSNRDLVRILINDTNTSSQLLSDEYIDYTIARKNNAYLAASQCAGTVAGQNTQQATKKQVGDLSLWYSEQATEYRTLAKTLRLEAASSVTPYSGGISVDDKNTQRDDEDWDRPFAEVGMHDHPNTNQRYDDDAADTGWR